MESVKSISFDFKQICRFCLSQGGVMSAIFDDEGDINGLPLASRIMACASVQLTTEDGLPAFICHCCLQQVELAYQFRRQCEEADATLRQCLGLDTPNFNYKERVMMGYATADAGVFDNDKGSNLSQNCNTEKRNMHCLRLNLNGEEIVIDENNIDSVLVVVDPKVPDYDVNDKLTKKKKVLSKENSCMGSGVKSKVKQCKNGRPFQCSVCTKSFSQRAHLTRHQLVHSGKKPFICTICNKSFADGSTLTTHYRVHSGERPYACETCQKAFVSRSDLRKHSLIHSGVRPFVCTVCSKTFTRGTNLRKHALIHSGQRPYSCEQCSRTFSSKGDLARHVLIHSGHRPHVCLMCCVSFSRRDKLVRHMRRHQGDLKPTEAELEMAQHFGNSLKVEEEEEEENVEGGQPPVDAKVSPEHQCATCGKVFAQRRELLRHEKVHTGDKPFACELCPKRFSRRDKLTRHSKVHQSHPPETHLPRHPVSYHRRAEVLRHQQTEAFSCTPCRVSFGSEAAYEKHIQSRHWEANGMRENDEQLPSLHVKDKHASRFSDNSSEPILFPVT